MNEPCTFKKEFPVIVILNLYNKTISCIDSGKYPDVVMLLYVHTCVNVLLNKFRICLDFETFFLFVTRGP